jgi:hypothetical protein
VLQLFRSNIWLVQLALPVLLAVAWFPHWDTNGETFHQPFSMIFHDVSLSAMPEWLGFALSFVLAQGIMLLMNVNFNQQDYLERQVFLPSLTGFIVCTIVPGLQSFTGLMCALPFVLLYFGSLTRMRQGAAAQEVVFLSGILLSIGLLFNWMLILLLPVSFIYLVVFRPFVWREWFWALVSALIVPVNFLGWKYVITQKPLAQMVDFPHQIYLPPYPGNWFALAAGSFLVLLVFSIYKVVTGYRTNSLRFRRLISAVLMSSIYLAAMAVLMILVTDSWSYLMLPALMFIIPVSWALASGKSTFMAVLLYISMLAGLVENWQRLL